MTATPQQRVPALRFKDDQGEDYPDWDMVKFSSLYSFKTTNSFARDKLNYTSGSVRNIHYGDIHTRYKARFQIKDERVPYLNPDIDLSKIPASSYCKEGDLAIADASEDYSAIGKTIELVDLNNEAVLSGLHTLLARLASNRLHIGYGAYMMASGVVKQQIRKIAHGTKVLGISVGRMKMVELSVPHILEQQKIVAFLSAVDSKIEELNKKKSLLEQYKKGMMQKLFSREIRFNDEDGRDYPNWEIVKFGNLYSFKRTNSFSRDKLNYTGGSVRNIHYGDIHTRYKARFQIKEEQVPFFNPDIDLSKVSASSYCKEGDLAIADASEDYTAIGKTIELVDLNNEPVLSGLHTLLARLDSDRIHVGYGAYMMASNVVKQQIRRIAHGTKVLGISAGRMKKVELPVPCIKEQQKIANFLSAIDSKIELVAGQIEQARSFKQGLLQQMFI